jgi:putative transposase
VDGTTKNNSPAPQPAPVEAQQQKCFNWFGKTLPKSFFEALKQDLGILENSSVFTLQVTSWLMILQRLSQKGTLATAVNELIQGNGRELLEPCKQVREENISANTGAYSRARQRVPVEAARRVAERTFEQLHRISPQNSLRDRLFLLDGSSIRLVHAPALLKVYPTAENQHGNSHWPVMRVAVMHHVVTALAMAPRFGAMFGREAVSEQGLAEPLIDGLPPSSVLIADRNFGIFSVAWRAQTCGHAVVVRLTEARAKRLSGGELMPDSDRKVIWEPSRDDRRRHPNLPAGANIEGRLIVARVEATTEILYLFTMLQEPAEQVVSLYRERWNIETDLRSLKDQVRLHTIPARSPNLVATELFIAIAGYNLIRSVMAEAAEQANVEPRRLSFSRSRESFWAFARAVAHIDSKEEFERHWHLLLRSICQSKLPKRHRPTAPRVVWPKPQAFPTRKVKKDVEKM